MLRTRIITALCLLLVIVPAMFFDPVWLWTGVSLVFVVMGAWEWRSLQLRMQSAAGGLPVWLFAALLAVAGLALIALHWWRPQTGEIVALVLLLGAAAFWLVPGVLSLRQPRPDGPWLAALLLLACWQAMIELRALGPLPLVAALVLVWAADVGAYFIGRAVGRRKLAPSISPGKSWEGAIGGAILVVIVGLTAAAAPSLAATLPALLVTHVGPVLAALALLLISALSVVGDLYESSMKRQAGAKDSGRSLPGHGGVLDRIDALIPVMPCVALLHRVLQ